MYCNGTCKYLNERKHKCELTGEKLSYMKQTGSLSFAVHEHRGICKVDREHERQMKARNNYEDQTNSIQHRNGAGYLR